jgi:hypothetical protein
MAIDLELLAVEIAKPAYVGMTDAEIAAAINAATYAVNQDIPTDAAIMALINTDNLDWGELVGVAEGVISATAPKRKRAITLRELLNTVTPLEVGADDAWWSRITSLLALLVTDGILSVAGRTAFEALRVRQDPFWQFFGHRELEYSDVAAARAI